MSGDFLADMAASSRRRLAAARLRLPETELRAAAQATPPPPRLTFSPRGFDVIAELKRRSPAMGLLETQDEGVAERIGDYADAGAAMVSVLTEPERFDGALSHLHEAVAVLAGRIPAMRKDFLVDPYQLLEARLAGAGGALIILRMLDVPQLQALLAAAAELGLFLLLEAFDETDLELAQSLVEHWHARVPLLVGINCRDLVTLQVVPGRLESLAPLLPTQVPRVAESGVTTAADAARLAACGYDLALVGSALMQAADSGAMLRSMLEAGRVAAFARRCG